MMLSNKKKLFQKIEDVYRIIGINNNNSKRFNPKNVFILCNLVSGFISAGVFCLFQAETVRDRAITFYASTTELCAAVYFISIIGKITRFFELIKKFEEIVNKSKVNNFTIEISFSFC